MENNKRNHSRKKDQKNFNQKPAHVIQGEGAMTSVVGDSNLKIIEFATIYKIFLELDFGGQGTTDHLLEILNPEIFNLALNYARFMKYMKTVGSACVLPVEFKRVNKQFYNMIDEGLLLMKSIYDNPDQEDEEYVNTNIEIIERIDLRKISIYRENIEIPEERKIKNTHPVLFNIFEQRFSNQTNMRDGRISLYETALTVYSKFIQSGPVFNITTIKDIADLEEKIISGIKENNLQSIFTGPPSREIEGWGNSMKDQNQARALKIKLAEEAATTNKANALRNFMNLGNQMYKIFTSGDKIRFIEDRLLNNQAISTGEKKGRGQGKRK